MFKSNNVLMALILFFLVTGCTSVPDIVAEKKEKFVQTAIDAASVSGEFSSNAKIIEETKKLNSKIKLKSLGVDRIEAFFATQSNPVNLDSVVLFCKSNYIIIYDFSQPGRNIETIRQNCQLNEIRRIDERLFIGKK